MQVSEVENPTAPADQGQRPNPTGGSLRSARLWFAGLGIALTCVVAALVEEREQRALDRDLATHGAAAANTLRLRVEARIQAMISCRAMIEALAGTELDRDQWRLFTEGLDFEGRLPGFYGLAWVERVDRQQVPSFTEQLRDEYGEAFDFQVRPHPAGDGATLIPREAYVIRYKEPLDSNAAAIGVDLATAPRALEAMRRACDTAQPTITGPMRLARDIDAGPNKLTLFVPVFHRGAVPTSVAGRRDELAGWIAGPLDLRQLFNGCAYWEDEVTAWSVVDVGSSEEVAQASPTGFVRDGARTSSAEFDIGGRHWVISAAQRPQGFSIATLLAVATGVSLTAVGLILLGRRRASPAAEASAAASLPALALNSLRTPVAVLDRTGAIVLTNDAWRIDERIARQPAATHSTAELICAELAPHFDVLWSGRQPSVAAEIALEVGRISRHLLVRVERIQLGSEQVAVLSYEDNTLRRHADEALLESRTMLEATASMAQVGGWELDVERDELRWSDELFHLHDLPLTEQPDLREAIGFFAPDARQSLRDAIDAALARGDGWDLELALITARGRQRWIRSIGRAECSDDRTVRILGSYHDVTDRRRALDQLRLSEERFRLIAEHATDGIWDWDVRSGRAYLSPSLKALLGYADHEVPNTQDGWQSLVLPEDKQRLEATLEAHVERGDSFAVPVRYRHKTAETVWVFCRGQAIFDEHGNAVRIVGTHTDITALKRAETELERARADAEAGSRAKSEFLANMSHEIRTPMTAILGYVDLLTRGGLQPEDNLAFLKTIERNGHHLLEIIDDILDLSKIEAGRLAVERALIRPRQVLEEVRELMAVRAEERSVALNFEVEGELPREVRSDALRLRQMLLNLVGNAIKFTVEGSVTIRAKYAVVDDRGTLQVAVIDTGIGISPEAQAQLFTPFTQADDSHSRTFGGTGLGLAISRRLAEMMGGSIELESIPGEGSTFTLTVDVGPHRDEQPEELADAGLLELFGSAESVAPALPARRQGRLDGRRLLVAEDGVDNQRLIQLYLQRAGATVELVANGREAIDRLTDSEQPRIDALLLDMQMPVLDGYHAAAELRAEGFALPIIALTAHAMDGDRDRCIAAGCNSYATKPVDAAAMIATVQQSLEDAARDGQLR